MDEVALSSRLSTSEKLLISQAVYKLGALDWEKISGLLVNHPVIEGRPAEWFDAKTCEAYYVGLMTEAGINVYVYLSQLSVLPKARTFHTSCSVPGSHAIQRITILLSLACQQGNSRDHK